MILSHNSSPVQDEMTVNMALHRGVTVKTKERNIKPTRVTCKPSNPVNQIQNNQPADRKQPSWSTSRVDQETNVVAACGPNNM